jgi:putative transposase
LGSFIAGFKAAVTSQAGRELNSANIWQRNYYERIVRNENELKNFWGYIETNPSHWQEDQLHPSARPNPFNQNNP